MQYSAKKMSFGIDHVVTTGGGCTAQGKCWYYEQSPTLKAGGVHAVVKEIKVKHGEYRKQK